MSEYSQRQVVSSSANLRHLLASVARPFLRRSHESLTDYPRQPLIILQSTIEIPNRPRQVEAELGSKPSIYTIKIILSRQLAGFNDLECALAHMYMRIRLHVLQLACTQDSSSESLNLLLELKLHSAGCIVARTKYINKIQVLDSGPGLQNNSKHTSTTR